MVAELLQKYIWLVQTFIKAGQHGLTLEELSDRWYDRWDSDYARRSFNNHREAVYDLFGIHIECDRRTNRYFIRYSEDVADGDSAAGWLINTFTVNNLLAQSKDRLSGRISVEDIPSGRRHLTPLMEAMQGNQIVQIAYLKYGSEEASHYTIYPYALKEADKRWYLVGWCAERSSVRVYGLDRITELDVTGKTFKMPDDFDVDVLFGNCYGVYLPDHGQDVEEVRFKAVPGEVKYFLDLPIHKSQKIVEEGPDGTVFSVKVYPNAKLIMDLMARGDKVEILAPDSLRDRFVEILKSTVNKY